MILLDQGYLKVVESWGSDEGIIESARMSTQGGFVSWDAYEGHPKGDMGLLRYLWNHKHSTPFEMAGFTVEVRLPLFVAREWQRHRTQSYSEASARYTAIPALDYLPEITRLMSVGPTKQGRGAGDKELLIADGIEWLDTLQRWQGIGEMLYQRGLQIGAPKELARLAMSVGRYTTMRAAANLRNWLAFVSLRQAANAQWEIQQYANAVAEVVKTKFPRTYEVVVSK